MSNERETGNRLMVYPGYRRSYTLLIGAVFVATSSFWGCNSEDTSHSADAASGGDGHSQHARLCPQDTFEESPKCTGSQGIYPTDTVLRGAWEFGDGRISGQTQFQLGLKPSQDLADGQGVVTSIDQAPPKATVTLDGGSETVDFYFAYEGDEAVQTVSIDDVVTLSRSDSWSIMRGDDYTIGTREVLADDFEHACVKSPAGFPEARLLASCQQKIDSDLSCSQPKKPVRLFGLELTEGSDSARAPMLETVHVGRWLGFLELGVQLRPGASPFCERDGAYASVVLVGPAT